MQSDMELFVAVVEAGSFSATARKRGVPASTISRQVTRMEHRLGVQLLHRSTRHLALTEIGEAYFERSKRIVADIQETEEAVSEMNASPRGTVRISAPPISLRATTIEDLITGFLKRCPKVRLDLVFESRYVDIIGEGFDVALRGGPVRGDANLAVRRLMVSGLMCVASPDYLAERGTPSQPSDLAQHSLLSSGRHRWPLRDGGSLTVSPRLVANDLSVVFRAATEGLGIGLLPTLYIDRALRSGQLVPVLADTIGRDTDGLSILFPHHRLLSPKVRAFVDYAVEHFSGSEL